MVVINEMERTWKQYWPNLKYYPEIRRDSVVGTATGYGVDDRGVGVRVPVGSRIFSPHRPDRLWAPPSLLSNGYPGVKRQGREADHSLVPRSRKCGSIDPFPHTPTWRSA
jgi:hypothetical protein